MAKDSRQKRLTKTLRSGLLGGDLPVLNPRDMIDPIVDCILAVDQRAEFIVMIADPRDQRDMSIRTCLHEPTKGNFLRTLANGLWPPEEDGRDCRGDKVRVIETPEMLKENTE